MDRKQPLTVSQLIELLSKVDQNAIVWAEGCDCFNKVVSVEQDRTYDGEKMVRLGIGL